MLLTKLRLFKLVIIMRLVMSSRFIPIYGLYAHFQYARGCEARECIRFWQMV